MPSELKTAHIKPLLKKIALDPDDLKNYRPVKVVERIVSARLHTYLQESDLHTTFQSAYKPNHSVESALTRVQNDLLHAMDNQEVTVLVLLDLSAAFDTMEHRVLLDRLNQDYGISGSALAWFAPYLSDRTQSVQIGGVSSSTKVLSCGVPQGSVLGPQLFSLYTGPLAKIISRHGVNFHGYADDNQLYMSAKPVQGDVDAAVTRIQDCVAEIRGWMRTNFLKLNDSKTEVIVISSKAQSKKLSVNSVDVGGVQVAPTEKVRDLGVVFDKTLSLISTSGTFPPSDVTSQRRPQSNLCMHSSHLDWICATRYCTDYHNGSCTDCRRFKTLLLGLSLEPGSLTT